MTVWEISAESRRSSSGSSSRSLPSFMRRHGRQGLQPHAYFHIARPTPKCHLRVVSMHRFSPTGKQQFMPIGMGQYGPSRLRDNLANGSSPSYLEVWGSQNCDASEIYQSSHFRRKPRRNLSTDRRANHLATTRGACHL